MLEEPDRIVGFEEQYAAAAAVMAQVAELPVRVVVGYRVPAASWRNGRAEVTAGDIAAWVELDAGEHGWIPVDVTPDRSRTPDPDTQGSTTEQIAIPNPPPPPPPPPQIEPPRQEEEAIDTEEEVEPVEHEFGTGTGLAPWAVIALGVAGVPLGLLVLFALLVVGWKLMRRQRRRNRPSTTGRVTGAWAEAVDRCTESGAPRLTGTTPQETVGVYTDDGELVSVAPALHTLADQVDRAAYAATPPTGEHADVAWRCTRRGRRRAAPAEQPGAARADDARPASAAARRVEDRQPAMTAPRRSLWISRPLLALTSVQNGRDGEGLGRRTGPRTMRMTSRFLAITS